jgi:hypothetical protein
MDPPDPDAHNNAANCFSLLSVIPPMPKFGSNFRITDPYLGYQFLTDPPDPDAQQCRKSIFFPALSDSTHAEVLIRLQNYGSVYLGGQLFTDPPDPDAQQCRKLFSVIPPMPKFPVAPTTSDPAAYAAYKRDYEEYSSWYEKV